MQRFDLTEAFQADCVVSEQARVGEIYHVARNASGGATLTPVANYFVWRPEFVEGFQPHWSVDCFVRQHKLAPEPTRLAELLVSALVREGLIAEPIWMSAYRSEEIAGKKYGDVFEG
jgi:hypothetical protein